MTPAEVRTALMASGSVGRSILPAGAEEQLSPASVRRQHTEAEAKLKTLLQEQDDVLHARVGKLAELQAEIDRKKAELQAEIDVKIETLRKKEEELQEQMELLQNQIWLLDSQIYVIYSVADRWLKDTRFGSFTEIVERANSRISEGDNILVVQHLVPDPGYDRGRYIPRAWYNDRGRGVKNRTHDCSAKDCTIYPVNLIEFDAPVKMVTYSYRAYEAFAKDQTPEEHGPLETTWDHFENSTRLMLKQTGPNGEDIRVSRKINPDTGKYELVAENADWYSGGVDYKVLGFRDEIKRHLYISVKKTDSWTYGGERSEARANFELYEGEYINLTYLNSVVLTWVINNRELGGWRILGRNVDYAYAIRYLNTMMDYIRKREMEEKKLIELVDAKITGDEEWLLKLSEFKFDKSVRKLTSFRQNVSQSGCAKSRMYRGMNRKDKASLWGALRMREPAENLLIRWIICMDEC